MNPLPLLRGRIDAIAIGASAGGIEALSQLLPALQPDSRLAVVTVVHLPRDRPSLLAEIFSAKCRLKVKEAEDKEPMEGGTIYFAPPDYHLLVDEGPTLTLSVDDPVEYCRPSASVLFESAAEVYGERLMGVILTGANPDGATGLSRVKRAGGITAVQSPDTAFAPAMPQAALETGDADLVLTLEQLAALFSQLG